MKGVHTAPKLLVCLSIAFLCIVVVPHEAHAAPTVTTGAATGVTETSATLNGNITNIGSAAPTVRGFANGTSADLSSVTSTTTDSSSPSTIAKAGTDTSSTAAALSLNFNHTLVSGSERLVVVTIGIENCDAADVTGVTYGGVAMTRAISASTTPSGCRNVSEVWYILEANLPSNGSQAVDITGSGTPNTPEINALAAQYTGVAQGAPDAVAETDQTVGATITNTGFSAVSGDLLVSAMSAGNTGSFAHGQSQTELLDFNDASSVFASADLIASGAVTDIDSTFTGTVNRLTRAAAAWSPGGGFSTGTFSVATSTLAANTTYYFRAYATNSSGTGFGSILSLLTLPAVPTGLAFGTVTATTTALSWNAPTGGASTYKLEVCSTGPVCNLYTGISGVSTTTYSLAGNTSYDYAVQATNATGDSAFTATSTQLTLPNVPGTPTYSNITPTTMRISWTAPTGGASTYKLARCEGGGCTNFANIQTGIGATFYDDSALTPETTYRYMVLGTNASGDGLYSAVSSSDTIEPPAERVLTLRGNVILRGGVILR